MKLAGFKEVMKETMKNAKCLICALLILCGALAGCTKYSDILSNTETDAITSFPAEEGPLPDPTLTRAQDRNLGSFLEMEDRYYYISLMNDQKVYVSLKEEPMFTPLCAKPDCAHSNENCNAWCGYAMGYWDGKLYGVVSKNDLGFNIIQLELDGTNHQIIGEVEMPLYQDGTRGGNYYFQFHKGYLYYQVDSVTMTVPQQSSFFRFSLSDRTTERLLQELLTDGATGYYPDLVFEDEVLYFVIASPDQSERSMYRCQLSDGTAERLTDWPMRAGVSTVENGVIHYFDNERKAFCAYDTDRKTFAVEAELPADDIADFYSGAVFYDTEYVYFITRTESISADQEFYIFNRSYELLDHISMKNHMDYLCAAGDKLFFTDNDRSKTVDAYLLRSDIGKGEAALQRVTDPASGR